MKSRAIFAVIFLAVLTAIPTMASAAFVHFFDCNLCHRQGAVWNSVDGNGVCIDCHDSTGSASFDFGSRTRPDDGHTSGVINPGFSSGDASAAFGNNLAPGNENSHNWGAKDNNPAAGASAASSAMYNSRRGASRGFVSCYKCHDPHTYVDDDYLLDGNEKMLRTAALAAGDGTSQPTEQNVEAMCVECHSDWSSLVAADRGLKSHPMIPDYNAFVAAQTVGQERYKPFAANGDMKLLDGGAGATKVGCTTCHGLHGADSNSGTATAIGSAGAGDGNLLKGDGVASDATGNVLCTSCHMYMGHPSTPSGTDLGCLVCHSGHSYNKGTPNVFVLRSEVIVPGDSTLPTAGTTVGPLRYLTIPSTPGEISTMYAGAGGDDGYCTGCHGLITDNSASNMPSFNRQHAIGEDCSQCHKHFDPANPTDPSWIGKGCDGCHGYPPTENVAGNGVNAGWASDLGGTGHDYSSNNGAATLLNEVNTPHATHASTNPVAANIDCKICHNAHVADFATQHNNGTTGPTFQNVLEGAYAMPSIATGGGALAPTYVGATTTCDTVYCHSNGNAADFKTQPVIWAEGAVTPNWITDCKSCHDDNTSGIGISDASHKNNTAAHAAHVTRYDAVDVAGSSCNLCHSSTTDGLTIDTPANHVNGTPDLGTGSTFIIDTVAVAIPTLGSGTLGAGGCAIYCHSDGNGNFQTPNPAWTDGVAAAACGACHSVDPATIDALQVGGAHALHLADPNGPMIASCDVCHTHDGSFAPNNGHIDKSKLVKTDACDACHGKPGTGWTAAGTVDESPTWTDPTTVRCDTCHSGTVGNVGGAAPYVDEAAYGNGHGKAGVAQGCTDCHEAATVAGHLGGATIDRTIVALGYVSTDDRAFCNVCHTTVGSVNNHNVDDGNVCKTCHAQHGEANGNDAMIKSTIATHTVTGFATQGVRTSYVKADFTGVCQACHNATTTKYFSPNKYEDLTHNPGQPCSDCHSHDSTPAFTGVGDSCDSCHGYPPATSAHAVHAPDSLTADGLGKVYRDVGNGFADVTACAFCHSGADLYTYSPSADQASGTPGQSNHNVSEASQDATLSDTVGYTGTNCTLACHDGASGVTAAWTDPSLACDACHYQAADPTLAGNTGDTNTISASHNGHFAAGGIVVCTDCHNAVADTTHITDRSGTSELLKVQGMATALQDEAELAVAVTFDDGADSCATAFCHSDIQATPPNGLVGVNYATPVWGNVVSCGDCHNAAPAGGVTEQTSGSHTDHSSASAYNIGCAECHAAPAPHGDQAVDVTINPTWGASASYSGTATPGDAYGGCSSVYCHSDAKATPTYNNPTWGTTINSCTACHQGATAGTTLSGAHAAHVVAAQTATTIGKTLGCVDCHTATVSDNTTIADFSLHVNGGVDVASCATNVCHSNGNIGNLVYNNPTFASDSYDCTTCHGDGLGTKSYPDYTDGNFGTVDSNSHNAHVGGSSITCIECHADTTTAGTSIDGTTPAQHVDGGIDVVFNQTGTYDDTANNDTCSTTYCHGSGTPQWGGAALDCAACHSASNALANSHGAHYESATVATAINANNNSVTGSYVFQCGNCHNGTTHAGGIVGADQAAEVILAGTGSYTAGAFSATDRGFSFTAGSCDTNDCHNDGTAAKGAPNTVAPQWTTTLPADCTGCHDNNVAAVSTMGTGAHTKHINNANNGASKTCQSCHTATVDATDRAISNKIMHINGTRNIAIVAGLDGGNSAYAGSCDAVYCHSTGQSTTVAGLATPTYATATWATPASGACGTCHKVTEALGLTSGSHAAHLGSVGVNGCADCHTGALDNATAYNSTNHVNQLIDVANSYGAAGAPGNGYGTCTAASCHDDGTDNVTPTETPIWGVAGDCATCHEDNMITASHDDHLLTVINATAISCDQCHSDTVKGVSAATGIHLDANVDVFDTTADVGGGVSDLGYPTSNPKGNGYQSCATTYCHGDTLAYSAIDGIDTSPLWGATLGTNPNNCDTCHGFPPDGLAGAGSLHPTSTSCDNCHFHVNGTNNGFDDATKHIDGTVQIDGGTTCTDCHGAGKYKDPNTNHPDHAKHTDVVAFLGAKSLSTNDYGDPAKGWFDVTYDASGNLIAGCGQCHPDDQATYHLSGTVDIQLDPASATKTIPTPNAKSGNTGESYNFSQCSAVYCHSDGAGTFDATPPTWGGVAENLTCADCHGNSPTTAAHGVHEVGIHYAELYNGTSGLLTATGGVGSGAAHGDTDVSSTISCATCHLNTVTDSSNADNTTCSTASCHSSGGAANVGDASASIKISSSVHLNGTPDVVFALTGFKSKAQLRDNLADADDGTNILSAIWNRLTGYKGASDYDEPQVAFNTPTFDSGAGTCSTVACHNGNGATWETPQNNCMACHTSLPK